MAHFSTAWPTRQGKQVPGSAISPYGTFFHSLPGGNGQETHVDLLGQFISVMEVLVYQEELPSSGPDLEEVVSGGGAVQWPQTGVKILNQTTDPFIRPFFLTTIHSQQYSTQ